MAKSEEISNNLNIIGNGTTIVGNIVSQGDMRIDGTLEGNLTTQSKIVIGTTSRIVGEVKCKDCEVAGNVRGKIRFPVSCVMTQGNDTIVLFGGSNQSRHIRRLPL